jgi:PKD domain-containing protein/flagellar hook capping protein FlgD/Big-like domain-containing protein
MHRAMIRLLTTSLVLALGVGAGVVLTPSPSLASPAAVPVLTVPGPQTVDEGVALGFVVSATDADGQPLFFRAAGMPSGATFQDLHDNTGSFSWTPNFNQAGTYGPTFIVDDTFGGVVSKGVPITVNNVNQAPVLDPIGDRLVERGSSLSIFVSGADPDGDPVTFSTTNLPSWGSFTDFGDGSASLGLAPPLSMMPTTVSMTVSLSDGSLTSSETFSIQVYSTDSGNAPVLAAIGDQTVAEGSTKNVSVSASDIDGESLSWTVSLPGVASFTPTGGSPGSASGTMALAPGYCDAGTYAASIGVSDGALTDNENFVITVTDVNRAPVWNPPNGGYRVSFNEGNSGDVTVHATDPDQVSCGTAAPTLWYLSTGAPAQLTVTFTDQGGGSGLLHVAAGFDAAGSYTLTLRAKDAVNPALSTDVSVSVTVVSVDRAPVASAGGPYSGLVGNALTMSAAGSSDPDGDALTYAWTFGDGGSGSGVEVSHPYAAAGTYNVTVTVSDGTLSDSNTTSADVRNAFLARAFTDHSTIRLKTGKPSNSVFLEAVGSSFPVASVDVSSLKLYGPEGLGTVPFITPMPGSVVVGGDFDRNGAAEVAMDFAKDDLRALFSNLTDNMNATMVVTADLLGGGSVRATLGWAVEPERKLVVRALPNPMNPETTIRVNLETQEVLSIRLYDLRGRLVRTVVDAVDTPAGVHDYKFDGKSASGQTLPSGQYFYRASTPTAKSAGTLIILK